MAAIVLVPLLASALGCGPQNRQDRVDPLGLLPPPPRISAADAKEYIDQLVVVHATIGEARVHRGQALLRPAGTEDLSILVAPPLLGPSPAELVEKYRGEAVVATGYISDFAGRPELLIGDPGRIRLESEVSASSADGARKQGTDPARSPASKAEPTAPAAAGQPVATAAVATSAIRRGNAPAMGGGSPEIVESAAAAPPDAACAGARDAWLAAAEAAAGPLQDLLSCLRAGTPDCAGSLGPVRGALAEVAASEERLRWTCGGDS